jgi:hypothetical protein
LVGALTRKEDSFWKYLMAVLSWVSSFSKTFASGSVSVKKFCEAGSSFFT